MSIAGIKTLPYCIKFVISHRNSLYSCVFHLEGLDLLFMNLIPPSTKNIKSCSVSHWKKDLFFI